MIVNGWSASPTACRLAVGPDDADAEEAGRHPGERGIDRRHEPVGDPGEAGVRLVDEPPDMVGGRQVARRDVVAGGPVGQLHAGAFFVPPTAGIGQKRRPGKRVPGQGSGSR